MSDIQLFRLQDNTVTELAARTAKLERNLQLLIEANMETFLGIRFLATEYITGKTHRGRVDSLGLDENGYPVIIEYKRTSDENVISQGLFYLDWLMDHRAEFRFLVMDKLGKDAADRIEWSDTRLLCIAADFTRYDVHAVQQIPRNIELIRYKMFGDDLLLLELVNTHPAADATTTASVEQPSDEVAQSPKAASKDKSVVEQLASAAPEIQSLYEQTAQLLLSMGDDVQQKSLKLYTAFRRLKNFACIVVSQSRLLVKLKLDPASVDFEEGFTRDVSQIGHWGTGDVEVSLRTTADLQKALPLLTRSYVEN